MGRIVSIAVVAGLSGALLAVPARGQTPPAPGQTPPAVASAQSGQMKDAASVLARVKQRYTDLNPLPIRLNQRFETVTRAAHQEDVTTYGTFITYQQGPNERTVLVNSVLGRPGEVGATAGYSGAAVGRLEWLRTANGLQIQYQPVPSGPQDNPPVTTIDMPAEGLDPQLRAVSTDPLATLQTFDLAAASNPSFRLQYLNGVEKYVIATHDPVQIAPGVLADLQFWIGKESLLVDRMVSTFEIRLPEQTTTTFIDFLADFTYEFDALIPAGFFVLPPPDQQAPRIPSSMTAPAAAPSLPRMVNITPYLQRDRDFLLKNYKH